MSAVWPLPEDIREPGFPDSYRADTVDEMAAGGLAVLAEVRKRIEAELAWSPAMTQRVLDVVDGYAREMLEQAAEDDDDFDDDPDAFPTMLAEAARNRRARE